MKKFIVALVGLLVLGVSEVFAGAAYTEGRAFLKEGCAFDAGKSYVGGGEVHPPIAPEASGKHVYREWNETWGYDMYAGYDRKKGSQITTTYHFWAQANPGYVFTGWYTKGANDVYTPVKDNTVDAVTYHYTDVHYVQSAKSGNAPLVIVVPMWILIYTPSSSKWCNCLSLCQRTVITRLSTRVWK